MKKQLKLLLLLLLWKKTQILIAHQKERIDWTKQAPLETRGFCAYFLKVDHPHWDV